jgi:hypothetical protein
LIGPVFPSPGEPTEPSPYTGDGVQGAVLISNNRPRQLQPLSFRLTAAVPSVNVVSIVTLSWTGRYLRVVPKDSTFIHLESESQSGLRQFKNDVFEFFSQRDIPLLLVRKGPATGPNAIAMGTARMATVLLSLPIYCPEPTSQRVVGWLGRNNPLLPSAQSGYPAKLRGLQGRAIETAAFGMGIILETCQTGVTRQQLTQICAQVLDGE